ncbi:bifunctional diguanylate cyclase/phosphodiesterase [Mesorhizobium sp. B3-2-1]|uniref:putative bifunctional diguanylate cyclase/phosphodiesterase n=1 Tax=Mesorhizobium sp. B3-2-1 TaxID=2589891 RepID=UPI0015E3826A|nr:bifunctional diguanylate cyclase/phosphodiesterase [Mesorhizobium sp. B3-2-1]
MFRRDSAIHFRRYIWIGFLGTAALATLVAFGVNLTVDHAVSVDAKARAEDWAKYFVSAVPDFDALLANGKLTDRQRTVVSSALIGNVFRFKLYDAKGNTVAQSDLASFVRDEDEDHIDDEASEVVETKAPIVSINEGTKERNMPALYAEAYVPVFDANGKLHAITEAYVDETKTEAFFRSAFGWLAVVLGFGFACAFGLPMLAYLAKNRQSQEAHRRAEFLATHDPMTSLLNRTRFSEILAKRIAEPLRNQVLGLIFIDVDDFKLVNDAFGHEAGDEFLKHVARAISSFCSTEDFVARVGGDEFVIGMHRSNAAAITDDVESIMSLVGEPISVRGRHVAAHVSAGVCIVSGEALSVEEALHRSDLALYQSKIDGKNRIRMFSSELEERMRARREIEELLREAVATEGFEIHYQPLVAAEDNACIGFEALLRLRDRTGAFVSPVSFIPIAESMGVIGTIGRWVIVQATRTAATWPPNTFVAVNLSVRQFADQSLVASVEKALKDAGLEPHRLELEVTESVLMENTDNIAYQLNALKALGVSIAMDDFGTGYSSLSYLWQFGFDKLKIDRSFVSALDVDDKKAREVLDTIVLLAHKLDMKVTAEGIESERQAQILRELACDQFQGYLFGRPVPVEEVAPIFANSLAQSLRKKPSRQQSVA